ncbi:lysozyme inhibitor LprI family protein [Xanthobacter sp. ZOL 2024]
MGASLFRLAGVATAVLLATGAVAQGASFSCAAAKAADEKTICASCDLQQLDVKMATLYGVLTQLVAMGQRGDMVDAQRAWLSRRALCGTDAACVQTAYTARIAELEAALGAISARGPF